MERVRKQGAGSGEQGIDGAANPRSVLPAPGFLLVSDLDHTLIGDERSLERFAEWFEGAREHLRLAYNSGRFVDSVMESVAQTALPVPDAIIGGVGTEIWVKQGAGIKEKRTLPARRSLLLALPDWPELEGIWDREAIRAVLAAHKELELQPEHLQSEYKVSCYGYELDAVFLNHLRRRYTDLGYAVNIVYSSDRDLDVLPAGIDKGTAAARLAAHWQVEPTNVMVAGDSGNDAPMFDQGFCGIIVGNATADLLAVVDGVNAYRATATYAAGVLEGLEFWLSNHPVASLTSGQAYPVPSADRGSRG